jgi:hypothetical protein
VNKKKIIENFPMNQMKTKRKKYNQIKSNNTCKHMFGSIERKEKKRKKKKKKEKRTKFREMTKEPTHYCW